MPGSIAAGPGEGEGAGAGVDGVKAAAAGLNAAKGAGSLEVDGAWSDALAGGGAEYQPSSSFWGAGASAGRGWLTVRETGAMPAGVPSPASWAVVLVGGAGVGEVEAGLVLGLGEAGAGELCS